MFDPRLTSVFDPHLTTVFAFDQRRSSDLLAMGDLSEATEAHLETLKMLMAAQQRLERAVARLQAILFSYFNTIML